MLTSEIEAARKAVAEESRLRRTTREYQPALGTFERLPLPQIHELHRRGGEEYQDLERALDV